MKVNNEVALFVRYAADVDDSSIADTYVLTWDAALQKHIYAPGGGGGCSCTWADIQPTAPTTLTGYGITLTDNNIWVGNGSNVPTPVVFSGDVTTTNLGVVTIANDAVTYAKMQEIPTVTLVGNPTGSTANPSSITLDSSLQFTGSALGVVNAFPAGTGVGSLAKWNGSAWVDFPKGTANQVLKVNSGATDIAYETIDLLPTPVGVSGYTLRSNGTNWVSSSKLFNNGTEILIDSTTAPPIGTSRQIAIVATGTEYGLQYYNFGVSGTRNGIYVDFRGTPASPSATTAGLRVDVGSGFTSAEGIYIQMGNTKSGLSINGGGGTGTDACIDVTASPTGGSYLLLRSATGSTTYFAVDYLGNVNTIGTVNLLNAQATRFYELTANGSAYVAIKAPDDMGANPTYTLTLPTTDSTGTQALVSNGSGKLSWASIGGGGDVVGPGSSTATAIAKYADTSGTLLADSGVLIDASNNVTGIAQLNTTNLQILNNTISITNTNGNLELTPNGAGFQRFYAANVNTFNYFDNTTSNGPANKVWLIGRTNSDASGDTLRNAWTINGGLTTIADATRQGEINFEVANTTTMLTALQLNSSGGVLFSRLRLTNNTNYIDIDLPSLSGNWAFTLPTGAGSNGQFLQTDGSGNASWASVSGSLTIYTASDDTTTMDITNGGFYIIDFTANQTLSNPTNQTTGVWYVRRCFADKADNSTLVLTLPSAIKPAATISIPDGTYRMIYQLYDGTNWNYEFGEVLS